MTRRAATKTCRMPQALLRRFLFGLRMLVSVQSERNRVHPARPRRRRCVHADCVQDVPARCWARQLLKIPPWRPGAAATEHEQQVRESLAGPSRDETARGKATIPGGDHPNAVRPYGTGHWRRTQDA